MTVSQLLKTVKEIFNENLSYLAATCPYYKPLKQELLKRVKS